MTELEALNKIAECLIGIRASLAEDDAAKESLIPTMMMKVSARS